MELEGMAVSQGSLRARHKQATRNELRRAAFELFETQGYARTSVDEIAQAAGVSRSTFFRYFPSKEDVLELDDRENALLYLKMLRERPKSESRLKALEETLVAYALAMRTDERREELKIVSRIVAADAALSAARAGLAVRWREEVANVLAEREGRAEPDVEDALAAAILSQMGEQIGIRWQTADSVDTAELIRSHFAALRHLVTDHPSTARA